jgi:hypothetical protein
MNDVAGDNLSIDPPLSAVNRRPSSSKFAVNTVPSGWVNFCRNGSRSILWRFEDGNVIVHGLFGLAVEPEAGGDFLRADVDAHRFHF